MKEADTEEYNNDINTDKVTNNYVLNKTESKDKIIMKCNQEFLTFDKKNYPSVLEDYLSRNEWETIAEEANLVIGNAYHLRKMEESVQIPKYMNIIFWTIFCFCLIDFIFLIIYTKKESANEIIIYFAIALILASCGIIIGLMFYNYSRELTEEKTIDNFIIEGMNEFLGEVNKKYENQLNFEYNHDKLEIECTIKDKSN